MRILRQIFLVFKETVIGYTQVGGSMLAAALSYYTIFSLSPLLVLAVSIAGRFFSEEAFIQQMTDQVGVAVGAKAAEALGIILEASRTNSSGVATSISLALMVVFASMMFNKMKKAINLLWGIATPPGQTVWVFFRTHMLSFTMVLVVIMLLLSFMVVSTTLVSVNHWLTMISPNAEPMLSRSNFGLTFFGFTVLFAIIFKILPDAKIHWQDVLMGAAFTSLLFTLGEYMIGFYLGRVSVRGAYGATSSVIIVLVWLYYSMQIILFGAKFTQVAANRFGQKVEPIQQAAAVVRVLQSRRKTQVVAVVNDNERGAEEN
jgi:membrane protein